MSLGNDAQWYLAALANNNGNSAAAWEKNAKEWQAYAQKLEQQTEKLKGDVVEWQAAAVEAAAKAMTRREIFKQYTGKDPIEVVGGEEAFNHMVEDMRPVAKETIGADLV